MIILDIFFKTPEARDLRQPNLRLASACLRFLRLTPCFVTCGVSVFLTCHPTSIIAAFSAGLGTTPLFTSWAGNTTAAL